MRSPRHGLAGLVPAGVTVLVAALAGAGVASADPIDDQRSKVEPVRRHDRGARGGDRQARRGVRHRPRRAGPAGGGRRHGRGVPSPRKRPRSPTLQAELGDVAVQAYLDAGGSGMGIFSKPSQFSEDLQRDELTRVALNSGTADSDDLETAVNELTEQQESLEDQRGGGCRQGRGGRRRPGRGGGTDRGTARCPGRSRGRARRPDPRGAGASGPRVLGAHPGRSRSRSSPRRGTGRRGHPGPATGIRRQPDECGGGGGGGGNTSSGGGGGGNNTDVGGRWRWR